jgi:hypothetical protein
VNRAGGYRIAVRYSNYWRAAGACVAPAPDGMTRLVVRRPGTIDLDLAVTAGAAIGTLLGGRATCREGD